MAASSRTKTLKAYAVAFIGLAALMWPGAAKASDLTGIWEVVGDTQLYGQFRFFIDVERTVDGAGRELWIATKRTGTRNVPARERHFYGYLEGDGAGGGVLTVQVRVALPGFSDPEWEEHILNVAPDGKTLRVRLSSTVLTAKDELGNDEWVYRKWDGRKFNLQSPEVTDYAFAAVKNSKQAEIGRRQAELKRVEGSISETDAALKRIAADDANGENERRLRTAVNAAYARLSQLQNGEVELELPEPPARVKRLQDYVSTLQADLTAAQDALIAAAEAARAGPDSSAAQQRLTSAGAREQRVQDMLRQAEERLRIIAAEEGYDLAPPTRQVAPEEIERARTAYEQAFAAWYRQSWRNRTRPEELEYHAQRLTELQQQKRDLEEDIAELEAAAKGLETKRQIKRILVTAVTPGQQGAYVAGAKRLEAVSTGLEDDIAALRAAHATRVKQLREIRSIRADIFDQFNDIADELTDLREELAGRIMTSAYKQAFVETTAYVTAIGFNFGTGGLGGAAIEAVFQGVWNMAVNDGIAFSNYDETAMQDYFHKERDKLLAENAQPVSQQAAQCSFIPQTKAVVDQRQIPNVNVAEARTGQISRLVPVADTQGIGEIETGLGITAGTATGIALKESLDSGALTKANFWLTGKLGELTTAAEATALMKQAQERAIREALGRTPERIAADHALDALRQNKMRILREALGRGGLSETEEATIRSVIDALKSRSQQARLLGKLDIRPVFDALELTEAALKSQQETLEQLTKSAGGFRKTFKPSGSVKGAVGMAGLNFLVSAGIGIAKAQWQDSIKDIERRAWARVFQKQLESAVAFQAYQRANCIYWFQRDIIAWLQRSFSPIMQAYDLNTNMAIISETPIATADSIQIEIEVEGSADIGARTRIGGVPCRRVGVNRCVIEAAQWANLRRASPTQPFTIELVPEGYRD